MRCHLWIKTTHRIRPPHDNAYPASAHSIIRQARAPADSFSAIDHRSLRRSMRSPLRARTPERCDLFGCLPMSHQAKLDEASIVCSYVAGSIAPLTPKLFAALVAERSRCGHVLDQAEVEHVASAQGGQDAND